MKVYHDAEARTPPPGSKAPPHEGARTNANDEKWEAGGVWREAGGSRGRGSRCGRAAKHVSEWSARSLDLFLERLVLLRLLLRAAASHGRATCWPVHRSTSAEILETSLEHLLILRLQPAG